MAPAATRKPARKVAAKTKAKPAAKATKAPARKTATKTKAPAATNGRTKVDQKAKLKAVLDMIKKGHKLGEVRAEHGAISKLLADNGYNTSGKRVTVEPINTKGGPQAVAKRIAARRQAGEPWYSLALATGKSESEVRTLLEDHGYANLTSGRVTNGGSKAKAPAKAHGAAANRGKAAKNTAKPAKAKAAKSKAPAKVAAKTPTRNAVRKPGRKIRKAADPS